MIVFLLITMVALSGVVVGFALGVAWKDAEWRTWLYGP